MNRLWIAVVLLTIAARQTEAQQAIEGEGDRFMQRLEPRLVKLMDEEKLPGLAVGVVADGKLVYARGFGLEDAADPSRRVNAQTVFHMASITKTFVAMAVMQLVEKGQVDLDAKVTKYLPYFKIKGAKADSITVRQILSHTAGLPDVEDYQWDKPESDAGALERYVRSVEQLEMIGEPGQKFAYSNLGYEVLGDLIAKVSGMSFEQYIEANILGPLGMSSSSLLMPADQTHFATGYDRQRNGVITKIAHYPYNRAHAPSSTLHSNIDDMSRWMIANINRGELEGTRVLGASSYDLLWKKTADAGEHGHMGLGWFITEFQGEQLMAHGGMDDGFLTYMIIVPSKKVGVVVMMNCVGAPMRRVWMTAIDVAANWDIKQ